MADIANESAIALELANKMDAICRDKPTASVYLAISMMLAAVEARSERPNRKELFSIISASMDAYVPQLKQ